MKLEADQVQKLVKALTDGVEEINQAMNSQSGLTEGNAAKLVSVKRKLLSIRDLLVPRPVRCTKAEGETRTCELGVKGCPTKHFEPTELEKPGPWRVRELEGKYYGTKVVNGETSEEIEVWFDFVGDYKPSEREVAKGWEPADGYDHVELERSYKAAKIIADALNKELP